jgi:hypothetical protein
MLYCNYSKAKEILKMTESKYTGMYDYKGFTIWNTGEKEWIAEPDWSIKAIEKYKLSSGRHSTIAKAKKWINETGINLKESDYL